MPLDFRDALQDALRTRPPILYLNTNVILDVMQGRTLDSVRLLERTRAEGWHCISSSFALMEALDVEHREEQNPTESALRRIEQRWESFVTEHEGFLEWVILDEDGWEEALTLAVTTRIRAKDCVHIATALITNCDVFVTRDQDLLELAQDILPTATPDEMLSFLEAKGRR